MHKRPTYVYTNHKSNARSLGNYQRTTSSGHNESQRSVESTIYGRVGTRSLLQFGTPKPENLLESDRGKIESDTIYILSNKALDNGAVLIVQPEIIEKVGDLLQQNYYLFPSSRHEMLVYPNSGHSMTAQEMETVVRRMNEQERSPEELLSDKILFYDYQERKLKLATEREKELVEENELQEDKISEKAENQPEKKEENTLGNIPRF